MSSSAFKEFLNSVRREWECNRSITTLSAGVVLLLVVATALLLTLISGSHLLFWGLPEDDRIECPGLTRQNCELYLCHYEPVVSGPSCFMKRDSFGFRVVNASGGEGLGANLQNIAKVTPYGPSLENVVFSLTPINNHILRFTFKDGNKTRYEVPVQTEFPLLGETVQKDNLSYSFNQSAAGEVFSFRVTRKADGEVLWNSSLGALLLSDQFLQIGSYLPSSNVFGLGEHEHPRLRHRLDFVTWPLFSVDKLQARDQKTRRNTGGPGVHPFYTCLEKSGKSHGVLFLNSNAMEVSFVPAPGIVFRTTGGILDFFVFVGEDPEHVIQLYTDLVGKPMMPPYWSLGFQISRSGDTDLAYLKGLIQRTKNLGIPQTVQYLSADYMEDYKDFTVDSRDYEGLYDYMNETSKELKWMIFLSPGIVIHKNNEPFMSGVNESVFMKPDDSQKIVVGKGLPTQFVTFPDFLRGETKKWWVGEIEKHHKDVPFDGIQLAMNEPFNFGTNEEFPAYCRRRGNCGVLHCPTGPHEDPPYNPVPLLRDHKLLSMQTLCMETVQGNKSSSFIHYDVHSLYGWSQTRPTLEGLQDVTGKRSLVVSQSTYPSSGRYAGHWITGNSTFRSMKLSIIGMLEFNLFGIPYVGADVCGTLGGGSNDLCKRWVQLGAFYPFFRYYNEQKEDQDQDPAMLKEDGVSLSREAILRRMRLNPYLYTLFFRAHVNGSTVVRPLFHEFPKDATAVRIDEAFMWGKHVMVNPIVHSGLKSVSKYLPEGDWWLFAEEKSRKQNNTGRFVIDGSAGKMTPMTIRGGAVLPYANLDYASKNGNYPTRINLYVFPSADAAKGELFVDDGESKDTIENKKFKLYSFKYSSCSLKIELSQTSDSVTSPTLESVVVFGAKDIGKVEGDLKFTKLDESVKIDVNKTFEEAKEVKWGDANMACSMNS